MAIKKSQKDKTEPIVIDNTPIHLGEQKTLKLIAGRTPSDNQITVTVHVYRAKQPGPAVLLMGGIHGDEINGIEVLNQMVIDNEFDNLSTGTVMVIPLLNAFGFNNHNRDLPDGKDMNRSFPGSSGGSLASRVASTLSKKIVPNVDFAIDLHTGGASRYNYPQTRYTKNNNASIELSTVFGAPFTIEQPVISGSFRKMCKDLGVSTVVYEAGESVRLCPISIAEGKAGIRRVLKFLEIKDMHEDESSKTTFIQKTSWIRAMQPGIFVSNCTSGEFITKGQPLGIIKSPFGTKMITVFSKLDGHIIGHNNAAVVNQGDPLFHVGIVSKVYEGF